MSLTIVCYSDGDLSGDTPHRNWKFDGIVDGIDIGTINRVRWSLLTGKLIIFGKQDII